MSRSLHAVLFNDHTSCLQAVFEFQERNSELAAWRIAGRLLGQYIQSAYLVIKAKRAMFANFSFLDMPM